MKAVNPHLAAFATVALFVALAHGVGSATPVFETRPGCVFGTEKKVAARAPEIRDALTIEYVFVPMPGTKFPSVPKTSGGRSLFNIGSGYYGGCRLTATSTLAGGLRPAFSLGGPKPQTVSGTRWIVPDVTNQVFVIWDGRSCRILLNGEEAGIGPCAAPWTKPRYDEVILGYADYGTDPLAQLVVRARVWNRVLSDAEMSSMETPCPSPEMQRVAESLLEKANGCLDEASPSVASLDQLFAEGKITPGLEAAFRMLRRDALIREGRDGIRFGALADDDGHVRHHEVPALPVPGRRLFVSPTGDDAAAGTEDAPLATLVAARDRVREIRKRGLPPGGVSVCLMDGLFPVLSTVELDGRDSGEPGRPIVWTAHDGAHPVLDGGFRVKGLKPSEHAGILVADVKATGYDALSPACPYGFQMERFGQRVTGLYLDGRILPLAREPDDGWYHIGEVVDAENRVFKPQEKIDLGRFEGAGELMGQGYWKFLWADQAVAVESVDAAAGTVRIRNVHSYTEPKSGNTFRFVNALSAIDEPGEWFLDRKSGRLYVFAPAEGGEYVLTQNGNPLLAAKDIHDLRIEGLVFQYGSGAGVTVSNATDFIFAGNVVRRFGGEGLVALEMKRSLVADNVFHTFGHAACRVTSGDRRTLRTDGLTVVNNAFSETGIAKRTYTPGVSVRGVGIEVVHNHFHDIPSSAILMGGNDHYVGFNLVERVVTESDDQGGIDMFGNPTWAGIRMCWNVWRDIGGSDKDAFIAGRCGIRLDDAISGMHIYGNRFIDCARGHFGGVQIHAGRFNEVENNLFVNGAFGMSFSTWGVPGWRNYFKRDNIRKFMTQEVDYAAAPYSERYPHLKDITTAPEVNFYRGNVFANVSNRIFRRISVDSEYVGNFSFGNRATAESAFGRIPALRPLPPMSDIGPYETTLRTRARRNDQD